MPILTACLPDAVRDVVVPPPFLPVGIGHARFGGGAARDARLCFLLSDGEKSMTLGESERALSEEDAGGSDSVFFHESRMTGGPSSAEKSSSGRSCKRE